MDEAVVESVLLVVEQIPAGCVVAYGDIAELVGIGPRQVGRIMHDWGENVAWWRVTNRHGKLPDDVLQRALPHWKAEGIAVNANGTGCTINRHRADLAALGAAYDTSSLSLAPNHPSASNQPQRCKTPS